MSDASRTKINQNKVKIVLSAYDEAIKVLSKPNTIHTSYTVIEKGCRKIVGSDLYQGSELQHKFDKYKDMIKAVSQIQVDDKVKKQVYGNFYKNMVNELSSTFARLKKEGIEMFHTDPNW